MIASCISDFRYQDKCFWANSLFSLSSFCAVVLVDDLLGSEKKMLDEESFENEVTLSIWANLFCVCILEWSLFNLIWNHQQYFHFLRVFKLKGQESVFELWIVYFGDLVFCLCLRKMGVIFNFFFQFIEVYFAGLLTSMKQSNSTLQFINQRSFYIFS